MRHQIDGVIRTQRLHHESLRAQLNSFFLSQKQRPTPSFQYAEQARDLLDALVVSVRSGNLDTITETLRSTYRLLEAMPQEADSITSVSFLMGPHGLIARLKNLFDPQMLETDERPDVAFPTEIFYPLLSSKHQDWVSVLRSLPATIHSRPLYEDFSQAMAFVGPGSGDVHHALLELHVTPEQAVRLSTVGGPTRISLTHLDIIHFKFLYTSNKPYRFRITEDYGLVEEAYDPSGKEHGAVGASPPIKPLAPPPSGA